MRNRRLLLWAICFGVHAILARTGGAQTTGEMIEGRDVILVVDARTTAPVQHGLAELTKALKKRGLRAVRQKVVGTRKHLHLVIGQTGSSPTVDSLLSELNATVPQRPESLCIKRLRGGSPPVILIAGRDARGLMYALLEVARAVELAPPDADPFSAVEEATESPQLAVRSISMSLYNADLEREWYYNEEFWRSYFDMLVRNRCNNFTLTFANQASYLNPPYPFLLHLPEYPNVKAIGLSDQDRERNLAMLRTISGMARGRGLDFTFAIWTQRPMYGPSMVEGISRGDGEDDTLPTEYCAAALKRLLQECPAITGVQFRITESGIPYDHRQAEFYGAQCQAVRECGRPVRVDLRYKRLRAETIQAVVATGLDVTVSTKFWCEHMGLAYHPCVVDKHNRPSQRYSYGAMLYYPRPYRVVYRMWTVGSQRILLWGDPDYARRFSRSCLLGGGEGFEVFAPLTNKGYGNAPGKWRILTDRSYEHYTWEYERYWMFYLVFGRMGYNPDCNPGVWRREFRHRFGEAASDLEAAYRQASQIITLVTAARLPAASEWSYWPEMDTGGPLEAYMCIPPSDTAQFYAIKPFKKVPGTGEAWQSDIRGYVQDTVAGELRAKWTPPRVSQRLRELADQTLGAVEAARQAVRDPESAEFRSTELDMRILAHLALYHAEKTLAGTHLEFFHATTAVGRIPKALEHIKKAAAAWEQIVRFADGAYHPKLVFSNREPTHWKDKLPEVRGDVAYVEGLLKEHGGKGEKFRIFPGESSLASSPNIQHTPITTLRPGGDLRITARVTSPTPLRRVVLHYRPVNQKMDWRETDMRPVAGNRFEATVTAREILARWDSMYYIEALLEGGGGQLWPSWEEGAPYVVVTLERDSGFRSERTRRCRH